MAAQCCVGLRAHSAEGTWQGWAHPQRGRRCKGCLSQSPLRDVGGRPVGRGPYCCSGQWVKTQKAHTSVPGCTIILQSQRFPQGHGLEWQKRDSNLHSPASQMVMRDSVPQILVLLLCTACENVAGGRGCCVIKSRRREVETGPNHRKKQGAPGQHHCLQFQSFQACLHVSAEKGRPLL